MMYSASSRTRWASRAWLEFRSVTSPSNGPYHSEQRPGWTPQTAPSPSTPTYPEKSAMAHKTGQDLIDEAKRQIEEVTPEQVREMQSRGERVVYLDVREPNEWTLGRLPHSVFLPRGNLESKVETMVDRAQRVVVYCARGNRSALAALTMKQMGYDKVASMARGFQGWAEINGEIEE